MILGRWMAVPRERRQLRCSVTSIGAWHVLTDRYGICSSNAWMRTMTTLYPRSAHCRTQNRSSSVLEHFTVEIRELRNSPVLLICHLRPQTQDHPFSLPPYLNETPITQQMWRSLTFITLWQRHLTLWSLTFPVNSPSLFDQMFLLALPVNGWTAKGTHDLDVCSSGLSKYTLLWMNESFKYMWCFSSDSFGFS